MPLAEEERIRALVRDLDEAIPRGGRVVVTDDSEEPGTLVRANQLGYLRLGIEFLKAAHAPSRSEVLPDRVELDLGYLTGLDDPCYTFERREDIDSDLPAGASVDTLSGLIGGAIFLFILATLLVGAFTILGWLGKALL